MLVGKKIALWLKWELTSISKVQMLKHEVFACCCVWCLRASIILECFMALNLQCCLLNTVDWLGKVIAALLDERLMRKIKMLTVFLQDEFVNQIILTASY